MRQTACHGKVEEEEVHPPADVVLTSSISVPFLILPLPVFPLPFTAFSDKYTIFSRKHAYYRKPMHFVPKFTKVRLPPPPPSSSFPFASGRL